MIAARVEIVRLFIVAKIVDSPEFHSVNRYTAPMLFATLGSYVLFGSMGIRPLPDLGSGARIVKRATPWVFAFSNMFARIDNLDLF